MSTEERCPECGGFRALPRILHNDPEHPKECDDAFHKTAAPVIEFPSPEPPAIPAVPQAQPAASGIKPICPHCGCDGRIRGSMTTLGPLKVFAVYCGNDDCRKYLGFFQPLEIQMVPPPDVH